MEQVPLAVRLAVQESEDRLPDAGVAGNTVVRQSDFCAFGFGGRYSVPTFGPGFCGFGVRSAIVASSQS